MIEKPRRMMLFEVMRAALEGAKAALAKTPEMLQSLRKLVW